jgi:hypothetical protein
MIASSSLASLISTSAPLTSTLPSSVPAWQVAHLRRGRAGVRAQALSVEGSLVDDFIFDEECPTSQLHVRNAPSPGVVCACAYACLCVCVCPNACRLPPSPPPSVISRSLPPPLPASLHPSLPLSRDARLGRGNELVSDSRDDSQQSRATFRLVSASLKGTGAPEKSAATFAASSKSNLLALVVLQRFHYAGSEEPKLAAGARVGVPPSSCKLLPLCW